MNQLLNTDNPVTMSTREIAAITGKQHKDVIRDVRVTPKGLALLAQRLGAPHSANGENVARSEGAQHGR